MSTEPPLNLVITTTTETPVISPLSSVKSSTTSPESSFRSVSPGDSSNPPSVGNSPQSISSSIGSRSGGHVHEGTVSSSHPSTLSSAHNSDDETPENLVTRKLQGLKLATKIEPSSASKMKPVTLLPPSGGAHTRTSPLYTPSAPAPGYYIVQKDGQVYNVEIPVDSTGSSQLSPGAYYPGIQPGCSMVANYDQSWVINVQKNITSTWSPSGLPHIQAFSQQPTQSTWSPSGLPHIQAFSQQPTQRGYEASPSSSVTGIYTDYQQPNQQAHQQQQAFLIHASHLPQVRSRPESRTHSQTNSPSSQQPQHHIALVQPQPSTPSKLSPKHKKNNEKQHSPEREQDGKEEDDVLSSLQSVGIGMSSSRKDKGHESEKIDNKHTKFSTTEVHREMFYSAEQARTVLTTATPVGVLLPTGEVQVSSLVAPVPSPPQQKVDRAFQFPYQISGSTLNKQEISTPSYSVGYPYQVYYDPTTQQVTYGYGPPPARGYASPSQPGTPVGQSPHGTPVAIYSPTGEITGPNSASSRAVYQFPLAGEWGASPTGFYTPPQKTRGKGVRQGPCLFVFHIPPSVTDDELHALFSTCGRVTSAKVMRNPHTNESKGFGFVNMANQREVEQAISTLHGYYWKNKYLKVSYKKKRYHSRNS